MEGYKCSICKENSKTFRMESVHDGISPKRYFICPKCGCRNRFLVEYTTKEEPECPSQEDKS